MILEELPLVRLRFDLETLEEAQLFPFKGDMLRMALLWWLSENWCLEKLLGKDRCDKGCRQPGRCLFSRLCTPPLDPTWPRKIVHLMGQNPPPAYALWDRQDRRRSLAAGSRWSFELALVGAEALGQIPAFGAAMQQGAEQGMGRIRLRSQLHQVSALREHGPEVALATERQRGDKLVLTWLDYRLNEIITDYAQAVEWAQSYTSPVRALNLRYLSLTKIKERGRWVEEPRFSAVARALVRRLRLLSVVHGAGEWPHEEYGPLLDLAETVRLEHDETLWGAYTRWSKSSGEQEVEGFIGSAWYTTEEDLRPLLPILWLGQWLHIGKEYVLGNGRYSIEQVYG